MNATVPFSRDVLRIDARAVVGTITAAIRHQVGEVLHRRGAVVGLSGGVDSSVCAALCVQSLGKDRVLGLLMPEGDSPSDSTRLGRLVADTLGMGHFIEDILPILDSAGCYHRQMEAIWAVFPEYGAGWKCKITIPPVLEGERLTVMRLTVESPDGVQRTERIPLNAYLELIAATNWKQRIRAAMEYYHADRLNYAVCGPPRNLFSNCRLARVARSTMRCWLTAMTRGMPSMITRRGTTPRNPLIRPSPSSCTSDEIPGSYHGLWKQTSLKTCSCSARTCVEVSGKSLTLRSTIRGMSDGSIGLTLLIGYPLNEKDVFPPAEMEPSWQRIM